MSVMSEHDVSERLRAACEAFLSNGFSAGELREMTELRSNGALLCLFEDDASLEKTTSAFSSPLTDLSDLPRLRRECGPQKFQFTPSEGIAFLYEQMGLPPPPAISFSPKTECIVVAVVCLQQHPVTEASVTLDPTSADEGVIYQDVFVFSYPDAPTKEQ